MRKLLLGLLATLALAPLSAQSPTATDPAKDISLLLAGNWAGYLEYRDYSEPATSTKRVQLPTWISVTPAADGLSFHYIYDDGPNKTVNETEQVVFDAVKRTYTSSEAGHPAEACSVAGFDQLHEGHGQLVMTCEGEDDGKPAERHLTMTLHRNLIEWLLETRPAGSSGAFAFRHFYRFTRAQPPKVATPR